MHLTPIRIVAAKEFRDRLRNRWVIGVALTFTALALVIAYFGTAQQGTVGFHSIELTIASLVSLVIYLVPLIALMLGFDAIVGERERGSLGLLLSMPVTRTEVLIGKYCGPGRGADGIDRRRLRTRGGRARHRPRSQRVPAVSRLHGQFGPARPRVPQPGCHGLGARDESGWRVRRGDRAVALLRARVRSVDPRRPGALGRRRRRATSSRICCCSIRRTSSVCSTSCRSTRSARRTASPRSSPTRCRRLR